MFLIFFYQKLYTDFELAVDECLFGLYQASQKSIIIVYIATLFNMDCTAASFVLHNNRYKFDTLSTSG